jgi:hypothetical protein
MIQCQKYLERFLQPEFDCELRYEYLKDFVVCLYNDENYLFDEQPPCPERTKFIIDTLLTQQPNTIMSQRKPHRQKSFNNPKRLNKQTPLDLQGVEWLLTTLKDAQ